VLDDFTTASAVQGPIPVFQPAGVRLQLTPGEAVDVGTLIDSITRNPGESILPPPVAPSGPTLADALDAVAQTPAVGDGGKRG
jgi:hypothetical protein